MIFFLDPRVFPRILRETPRRHQCDIIVLDFLRCSARFVRDSDVFRCSACFVCGFWVLGTKPWMTIFFRVLCGWAFRTAPVTAGNAFSRRDLSIARRGARTRDKRPALTQQPNLYLEPNGYGASGAPPRATATFSPLRCVLAGDVAAIIWPPLPRRDTLAERLRRRPAKPMGSPRVGSNPTGVVCHRQKEQRLAAAKATRLISSAIV